MKEVLVPLGYNETCDSNLFNFWIENMLIPKLKKGQIVIMDNASIHKSDTTAELISNAECELLFLPAYSPDLNPIEHFWATLKKKVRYNVHKFSSLQDTLD